MSSSEAEFLGQPVVILGREGLQVVYLTRFDKDLDGSAVYDGVGFMTKHHYVVKTLDGGEFHTCPVVPYPGLRPYPYEARPDYAFQFVPVGGDYQALIDVANRGAAQHTTQPIEQNLDVIETPAEGQPPAQTFEPADLNKDGVTTKKEQRLYDRERGGGSGQ